MSSSSDEMEGEVMEREVLKAATGGGDRRDMEVSYLIAAAMYCRRILVNCHVLVSHCYTTQTTLKIRFCTCLQLYMPVYTSK